MSDFDDELNGYLQARTASDHKERQDTAAANAAADALFGPSFPFPHPEGFLPTQEAPAFAFHSVSQLWHDANTGTYSYYDATTETYIPVEAPTVDSLGSYNNHHEQSQHLSTTTAYDSTRYQIDPHTGYAVELPAYGDQSQNHCDTPPESDATLRLCVLSSNVLKVGGVIMMDASGLSFGRDRPLSGQGNRVRMVEMEISRFHASIYLDRQEVVHEEKIQAQAAQSPAMATPTAGEDARPKVDGDASIPTTTTPESGELDSTEAPGEERSEILQEPEEANSKCGSAHEEDNDREDGEIPDSPGAGAKGDSQEEIDRRSEGQEISKETNEQHHRYHDYQWRVEEYQQYYHHSITQPTILDTFKVIDCGSTHGTFLNGERLSDPKTASHPFALNHMDRLQLGSTVFEIHAHEDGRICGTCQVTENNEIEVLGDKDREPVTGAGAKNGKDSPLLTGDLKLSKEMERIEEMNRLKKKWAGPDKKAANAKRTGMGATGVDSGEEQPREYIDRAAKRRLYNPDRSSPVPSVTPTYSPPEITSGFHVPVAKTNKGHAMLSKMGWKAGTGLGAARQGVIEPVQLMVSEKKAGLGSGALKSQGEAAIASTQTPETPGEVARRKARERYAQLK
ncbi:Angiogenic factor with G patch and FHA domains 1 [Entomortierella chlamydospora]|nr:Angiogenic factor with G patch and FHA domains 1 [Entomortierella chlamydospora]